jgi:hypothetical protein
LAPSISTISENRLRLWRLPLTDAQSVRSYFTTGLAELILDDRAAATKQGEAPVLSSDPFIGHAEWGISDLSAYVKNTAGFKTVGTISSLNFGKPEKIACSAQATSGASP